MGAEIRTFYALGVDAKVAATVPLEMESPLLQGISPMFIPFEAFVTATAQVGVTAHPTMKLLASSGQEIVPPTTLSGLTSNDTTVMLPLKVPASITASNNTYPITAVITSPASATVYQILIHVVGKCMDIHY